MPLQMLENPDAIKRAPEPWLAQAVTTKASQASGALRTWLDRSTLEANLTHELARQIARIHDEALAAEFHEHCAVPGTRPEDYRNGWLKLPNGDWALIGIRFRGLDLDRPFIDVVAQSQVLRTEADLETLAALVAPAYARFHPKHVRFFVAPDSFQRRETLSRAFVERCYLAAPFGTLRARPRTRSTANIVLTPVADLSFYERFADEYAGFSTSHPEHSEYADPATKEDMAHYQEEACLYEVEIDGNPAGIVAGMQSREQGMNGIQVGEFFLYESHIGRGLAPAVQRAFIEALDAADDEIFFGVIDTRNAPAVRTALRCGRENVGNYIWMPT